MSETLIEKTSLRKIAQEFGTPTYIYSRDQLEQNIRKLKTLFSSDRHLICYAAKANSNLHLLKIMAEAGLGVDTVSGGEIFLALKAGFSPEKIIFSGVGKTQAEIVLAIHNKIKAVHVESLFELRTVLGLAEVLQTSVDVGFRLNPSVKAKTHPKIATGHSASKFGIYPSEWVECVQLLIENRTKLNLVGISCHIGSQIFALNPFEKLAVFLEKTVNNLQLQGFKLHYIDFGGGVGVPYDGEKQITLNDYGKIFKNLAQNLNVDLITEPGRLLIANTGFLLTSVLGVKKTQSKEVVVLDAGMSDFLRPALYDAKHTFRPVTKRFGSKKTYDFVGPVCESADIFLKNTKFQKTEEKDLILIENVGAYGFSMASHYNSRPKACEVLVDGDKVSAIRRRETYDDLCVGFTG